MFVLQFDLLPILLRKMIKIKTHVNLRKISLSDCVFWFGGGPLHLKSPVPRLLR